MQAGVRRNDRSALTTGITATAPAARRTGGDASTRRRSTFFQKAAWLSLGGALGAAACPLLLDPLLTYFTLDVRALGALAVFSMLVASVQPTRDQRPAREGIAFPTRHGRAY